MATTQQILTKCKKLISQPNYRKDYLLDIKKKGRGITGYFSNYIPEEIIAAAGLHPLRIIGFYDISKSPHSSMFNPVCSFVQDVFSAACSGEFSFLSNIVFPNSCDSLRVLEQMWKHNFSDPPAYILLHPINTDSDSIQYFAREIERFAEKMQKDAGINFTRADLKKSIDKYNQTRGLLRKLYDIRKTNNAFLAGSDAIALMTAGLIMDRDEYNATLMEIIKQGENNKSPDKNRKRIMIIGPLVDNYMLLDEIEKQGAYIIYDDITNGSRYCDLDVETEGDLYRNLARQRLLSAPSPTLNSNKEAGDRSFRDMVGELDLHGIIFIIQKFCEPHIYNYLAYVEILKKMDLNFLILEIEHGNLAPNERDLLRIESFIEIAQRG